MKPIQVAPALLTFALAVPLAAQQHPSIERGIAPDKAYSVGEIDSVNLFNGSLSLAIPIGGTYTVGGNLSYGLTLSYTSSVWELWVDEVQHCQPPYDDMELLRADPVSTNAGLGWHLGLGEVKQNGSYASPGFTYTSPGGGQHRFYPTLHDGETATAGVAYTRDDSYLRLKYSNPTWCGDFYFYQQATVEFPNGNSHAFQSPQSCADTMRPTSLADVYGNTLAITYEATRWVLQDTHGRTHHVNFDSNRVASVSLDAFDDPGTGPDDHASYTFSYTTADIARSCKEEISAQCPGLNRPREISVAFLTSVQLPDGSSWSVINWTNAQAGYSLDQADPGNDYCTTGGPKDRPGTLTHLTAPTAGRFRYTYSKWENPSGAVGCYFSTSERNAVMESAGVYTREVSDPLTSTSGTWTYAHDSHRTGGVIDANSQESWTVLTSPDADDNKHWFRTRYCLDGPSQEGWDYGLPFTRGRYGTANPPFTSIDIYDGAVGGGTLKRTHSVTYAHDTLPFVGGNPPNDEWWWHNSNRRVNYEKTVFADDGNRWMDVTYTTSTFDGLGHFRTVSTNGNFNAGN